MDGFGWNFYGFFLFCIAWIAGYFLWAGSMARREERLRPERGAGGKPGEAGPESDPTGRAPNNRERAEGRGPASTKRS